MAAGLAGSDGDTSGDDELWGDLRGFWSDEDDQDFADHWKKLKKHRKGPSTNRGPGKTSRSASNKVTHEIVTHYNSVTQVIPLSEHGQETGVLTGLISCPRVLSCVTLAIAGCMFCMQLLRLPVVAWR